MKRTLISLLLQNIMDIQAVQYAFMGIRAAVLALVIKALWSMYKQCPKGLVSYVIMTIAFIGGSIFLSQGKKDFGIGNS